MTNQYVLSSTSFLALAAGEVDSATARTLFSAQISTDRLLTLHILRSMPASESLSRAVTVLSEAQRLAPHLIAALSHEAWSGSWIARCLDALKSPRTSQKKLENQAARLGALAAVAAKRAGIDAETSTLPHSGRLMLPTLGMALLPTADGGPVRLVVRDGTLTIRSRGQVASPPSPHGSVVGNWLATRRLTAEHDGFKLDLIFDDLDPLRDCYAEQPAERVPDGRYHRWRDLASAGWRLLCRHSPKRATELSRDLRVLVPLAAAPGRSEISVTSQDAMGALAMTLPTDPARFAIGLVHEHAHSILNGLLNLLPLYEQRAKERYFAPWRPDPRPIGGLLHGAYAFLAVADTWLALSADTRLRRTAQYEFALRRAQLDSVLDTFASAESLTPEGRKFVAGMRQRCDALMAQPIPTTIAARADEVLRAQRELWRQHNRQ